MRKKIVSAGLAGKNKAVRACSNVPSEGLPLFLCTFIVKIITVKADDQRNGGVLFLYAKGGKGRLRAPLRIKNIDLFLFADLFRDLCKGICTGAVPQNGAEPL